jgi:hypothetical protein
VAKKWKERGEEGEEGRYGIEIKKMIYQKAGWGDKE